MFASGGQSIMHVKKASFSLALTIGGGQTTADNFTVLPVV